MNAIVDFFRDYWNDYRAALPIIAVAIVVALAWMGFDRLVRSRASAEIDAQRRDDAASAAEHDEKARPA